MGQTSLTRYGFTRDPHAGWAAGVCAGFARHFGVAPLLIRLIFIGVMFLSGFFPALIAYVVLAFVVPAGDSPSDSRLHRLPPASIPRTRDEAWAASVSLDEVEQRFDRLAKRLERLESYVVSDSYRLDQEFRKLRG